MKTISLSNGKLKEEILDIFYIFNNINYQLTESEEDKKDSFVKFPPFSDLVELHVINVKGTMKNIEEIYKELFDITVKEDVITFNNVVFVESSTGNTFPLSITKNYETETFLLDMKHELAKEVSRQKEDKLTEEIIKRISTEPKRTLWMKVAPWHIVNVKEYKKDGLYGDWSVSLSRKNDLSVEELTKEIDIEIEYLDTVIQLEKDALELKQTYIDEYVKDLYEEKTYTYGFLTDESKNEKALKRTYAYTSEYKESLKSKLERMKTRFNLLGEDEEHLEYLDSSRGFNLKDVQEYINSGKELFKKEILVKRLTKEDEDKFVVKTFEFSDDYRLNVWLKDEDEDSEEKKALEKLKKDKKNKDFVKHPSYSGYYEGDESKGFFETLELIVLEELKLLGLKEENKSKVDLSYDVNIGRY